MGRRGDRRRQPGAKLPSTDIVVAHRSDGSGTTQNFTTWLSKAAPSTWTLDAGFDRRVAGRTQAGNGNAGVAQIIKDTKGVIGYVDLSDAKASGLKYATSRTRPASSSSRPPSRPRRPATASTVPDDLVFSALDSTAPEAYPITYQSWVIVYEKQPDAAKAALLKVYLSSCMQ